MMTHFKDFCVSMFSFAITSIILIEVLENRPSKFYIYVGVAVVLIAIFAGIAFISLRQLMAALAQKNAIDEKREQQRSVSNNQEEVKYE